jgi:hypothetical protein
VTTLVTKYAGVDLSTLGVECEVLEGVESSPPVRGSGNTMNLVIPYQHGQRWVPKYYDERPIVLKGLMIPTGAGNFMYSTDALRQLFPIGAGEQKLEVSRPDGSNRYIMAEVRNTLGIARDASQSPAASKFSIELVASDPFWYNSALAAGPNSTPWFLDGASAAPVFQDNFENPSGASNIQTLFRSLGTDATGTLNAWSMIGAGQSIAANVVTLANTATGIVAGHFDWTDIVWQQRFKWNTANELDFMVHRADANNFAYASITGMTLGWNKIISGGYFGVGTPQAAALVNGTQYWIQITVSGATFTAKIFADNAGAINLGSQVGVTNTVTISDPTVQAGQIQIYTESGSVTFGGAFANVCQVTGPAPAGWTASVNVGESAFCWSKVNPYAGAYSLSIYCAHISASGNWNFASTIPAATDAMSAQIKTNASAGGLPNISNATFGTPSPPADSAWHAIQATGTFIGNDHIYCQFGGVVGTAYFDYLMVVPGTIGAPVNLDDGAHWLDQPIAALFAITLTQKATVLSCKNAGTAFNRKPVFTLTGAMVNPTLTNLTNGLSIQVLVTVLPGQVLTIDCGKMLATLSGAGPLPASAIVLGSSQTDWMRLESGGNSLNVDVGVSGSPSVAYQASFAPAYL